MYDAVERVLLEYEPVTIREAAQLEILLFVGLAFVGGLAVVYWGFQTYQFGRVIRDTPPEPIQSVAMGRTEITGRIRPATRVYDQPFTEGQCVYGELTVREYREYPNDDDKDDQWVTVQTDSFSTDFYIDDGTGRMLVDTSEDTLYEISDEHTTEISVSGGETPPEQVRAFLGSGPGGGGTSDAGSADAGTGGIRDRLRGALGRVGIFGGDAEDDEVQGGDPDAVDMDARAEPTDSEGVEHIRRHELGSVSSTSRDRRYSQTVLPLTEGYVFGGATRREPAEVGPGEDSVCIRADPSTGEFIVSDRDEFDLARTYRNRSFLYIAAGILVSAFILALLVQILVTGPVYGIERAMP